MTMNYVENITTLEQQLKASHSLSVASSFLRFSKEDFKELAFKIQDDHKKLLIELFEWLNEILDSYNSFEHHFDAIYDHNQRRNDVTKYFEYVIDW